MAALTAGQSFAVEPAKNVFLPWSEVHQWQQVGGIGPQQENYVTLDLDPSTAGTEVFGSNGRDFTSTPNSNHKVAATHKERSKYVDVNNSGVVGTLDQQTWQTDKGETRSSHQIIADKFEFIKVNGKGSQDGSP